MVVLLDSVEGLYCYLELYFFCYKMYIIGMLYFVKVVLVGFFLVIFYIIKIKKYIILCKI